MATTRKEGNTAHEITVDEMSNFQHISSHIMIVSKYGCVFTIDCQKYMQCFFKSRVDHQMTEIFVSGTEVFSDVKMTETPYE